MSSQLKSEFITRRKKVNGFTGVGALFADGDDQLVIICANEVVLARLVRELLPHVDLNTAGFQNLTIIQAE